MDKTQRGQSSAEYLVLIVLGVLILTMRVEGQSTVDLLLAALETASDSLTFLLGLPIP